MNDNFNSVIKKQQKCSKRQIVLHNLIGVGGGERGVSYLDLSKGNLWLSVCVEAGAHRTQRSTSGAVSQGLPTLFLETHLSLACSLLVRLGCDP